MTYVVSVDELPKNQVFLLQNQTKPELKTLDSATNKIVLG